MTKTGWAGGEAPMLSVFIRKQEEKSGHMDTFTFDIKENKTLYKPCGTTFTGKNMTNTLYFTQL